MIQNRDVRKTAGISNDGLHQDFLTQTSATSEETTIVPLPVSSSFNSLVGSPLITNYRQTAQNLLIHPNSTTIENGVIGPINENLHPDCVTYPQTHEPNGLINRNQTTNFNLEGFEPNLLDEVNNEQNQGIDLSLDESSVIWDIRHLFDIDFQIRESSPLPRGDNQDVLSTELRGTITPPIYGGPDENSNSNNNINYFYLSIQTNQNNMFDDPKRSSNTCLRSLTRVIHDSDQVKNILFNSGPVTPPQRNLTNNNSSSFMSRNFLADNYNPLEDSSRTNPKQSQVINDIAPRNPIYQVQSTKRAKQHKKHRHRSYSSSSSSDSSTSSNSSSTSSSSSDSMRSRQKYKHNRYRHKNHHHHHRNYHQPHFYPNPRGYCNHHNHFPPFIPVPTQRSQQHHPPCCGTTCVASNSSKPQEPDPPKPQTISTPSLNTENNSCYPPIYPPYINASLFNPYEQYNPYEFYSNMPPYPSYPTNIFPPILQTAPLITKPEEPNEDLSQIIQRINKLNESISANLS